MHIICLIYKTFWFLKLNFVVYPLLLRYMQKIDSGLLYYLSTDQTLVNLSDLCRFIFISYYILLSKYVKFAKGTTVQRSDLIGLIMRRNELAHSIIKASSVQQLPPMLQVFLWNKPCQFISLSSIFAIPYSEFQPCRIQICAKVVAISVLVPFIIR